jgi:hypothetical protein
MKAGLEGGRLVKDVRVEQGRLDDEGCGTMPKAV